MEEERMEQPRRRRKPKSFFRRLLELPKKTLLTLVAMLVLMHVSRTYTHLASGLAETSALVR